MLSLFSLLAQTLRILGGLRSRYVDCLHYFFCCKCLLCLCQDDKVVFFAWCFQRLGSKVLNAEGWLSSCLQIRATVSGFSQFVWKSWLKAGLWHLLNATLKAGNLRTKPKNWLKIKHFHGEGVLWSCLSQRCLGKFDALVLYWVE